MTQTQLIVVLAVCNAIAYFRLAYTYRKANLIALDFIPYLVGFTTLTAWVIHG